MSTLIDLSGYGLVKHAMFIKLTIPDPNDTPAPGSPRANEILHISNFEYPLPVSTIEGSGTGSYDGLGIFLGVSQFQNELRPSANDVSITISGIPVSAVAEALRYPVKGCPVEIRRGFFDPTTNQLLAIAGNPAVRYKGIINNYTYTEDWDNQNNQSSFSATLSCSSLITLLSNKTNGRFTNQEAWEYWSGLPTADGGFNAANVDISMNRVSTIATTNWNFGGPVLPGAGSNSGGGSGGGSNSFDDYSFNLP